MHRAAAELGIQLPSYFDMAAAGAAAAIVALVALVSWFMGRKLGPRLAALWEHYAGDRGEVVVAAMCGLTRYLVAWILLALALRVYDWPPLANFILGLGVALAAALLVGGLVRGFGLRTWLATAVGAAVFVFMLADALGGLAPITSALDRVGFTVGETRFSLLAVLQILLILLALYAVVRVVHRVASQSIKRASGLDPAQQLLAQKLAGIAIIVAAFFVGIELVGIDLTALAVFSGALGLAVGFGLQKTLGNLFAGIILLMDRSVKPGDVIVVGDSFGTVSKIGVRAVSVVTRDGKEHLIPNEDLMTREVENWSYSNRNVRIHIPVGVSYTSDIALAQRLMIQAAMESPRVLRVPKPNVWLRGYGDNSVDHEILVWISDPEVGVGNVQSEILNRLWVLFKEHEIEIPFPQRDVHVKEWPGRAGA